MIGMLKMFYHFFEIYLYFVCMWEFWFVHHSHAEPVEAREGHWVLWNWNCRWLLAAMWVQGVECTSS